MKLWCALFLCALAFSQERLTLEGGPLFWYPCQSGLDVAVKSASSTSIQKGSLEDIDPNWGVGGKLALNVLIPTFEFSVFALWTHLNAEGSAHISAPSGGAVFPIWSVPAANLQNATRASGKWNLAFNTLDVGVKGVFKPVVWLEFSPSLALKNAWIDQEFRTRMSGPGVAEDKVDMQSDMWGIGPRLGIDSLWHIGQTFGIYIDLAGALLWDSFATRQKETQAAVQLANLSDDAHLMRAMLEFSIGPFAQKFVANEQYLLRASLGYDAQIFFSQNRFRHLAANGAPDDGNLFLQGVYLKLTLGL